MNRIYLTLIIIIISISLSAQVIDRIVAKVGNDIILQSDLQKQIYQMKSANMLTPGITQSDILEQMVENKLIVQKAKELNLTVDEAKIKQTAEKYVRQIKARSASEEEFNQTLKQMKLTYSDLLKYYVDLMTEQSLGQQIIQKQIIQKIVISNDELLKFYNANRDTIAVKPVTYKIGMIMREIKPSPETDAAKLKAIRMIQQMLNNGADFAKTAKETSDCPSAEAGGDLGFFKKGMMVKPFEDAVFSLKVGEISDVVKTNFGYHLIKLEEVRGDEVRARHILKVVEPSEEDIQAQRALMNEAREAFLSGKPFGEVARKYSLDSLVVKDDGIVGDFAENEYPELFATVLQALPVGGITDVLTNENVLYLFAKLEEIPSRIYSFEEMKSSLRNYLMQAKQMEAYQKYLDQLKKENYVEILL